MDEQRRAAFEQMVGECFADAVSPPVPFEDASAHECYEAVASAFATPPGPADFYTLSETTRAAIQLAIAAYFECLTPTDAQVDSALAAIASRWPDAL